MKCGDINHSYANAISIKSRKDKDIRTLDDMINNLIIYHLIVKV
jgi:uncharacterized protein YunC (DUF1805 family)